MPSPVFPEPPPSIEPTSFAACDDAVARLRIHKESWLKVTLPERIALLDELADKVRALAQRWANLGAQAEGFGADTSGIGEEYLSGPLPTLRNIMLLKRSLEEIGRFGIPTIPKKLVSQRPEGTTVVQVFPCDLWDSAAYMGITAEVWQEPGITPDNLRQNIAEAYRKPPTAGKVALVLGAGNQSSIPAMDALYKLYQENEVVLLKMNPVNEYLGPVFRELFSTFVEKGWFEVVYGGGAVGAHLCNHPGIEAIHITGSAATHDTIVWGPLEGRDERKKSGQRVNDKPISSELGNVTPIVIVPARWSSREMAFQVENIASMITDNASFNCIAGKVLVTSKQWAQRDEFLEKLKAFLQNIPSRKAYYPGARARWEGFRKAHPEAQLLVPDADDTVPWTFIGGLDPKKTDDICFREEPFCAVVHEVALDGETPAAFLANAVPFCNDVLWGTLGINLMVHPSVRRDDAGEAAFQKALTELKYGTIGVNIWCGIGYGLAVTPWGAHPGHPLEDIRSGRGFVHNTRMFDKPLKSVVYAAFTLFPKPAWFVTNKMAAKVAPKALDLTQHPSVGNLVRATLVAVRG